ncbi:MAG: carboxypeptidase regulatory-like domain-containing protein [Bacteroidetes bacterium]|nr:carboxypeptidase regulatory-like domain-containing protein [Bacteroidota bacterium]
MKLFSLRLLFVLLLVLPAGMLHAQFKRANRLLASGEYVRAINAYERGLRKQADPQAMENVANCYRIVRNYPKAEYWYARTLEINPAPNPMLYFWYGSVLKMNGKPEEARKQFERFTSIKPDDERGKAEVKALSQLKVWMEETRLYEVKAVPQLNTPYSDFGVAWGGRGMLIVSDRGEKDLLNAENASATDAAYFAIYSLKFSRSGDSVNYGVPEKLPRRICPDNHNGPASLTADGKLMAFNRVGRTVKLRSKKFVNRNKIYFTNNQFFGWSNPEPFLWNSDLYSCAHPSLSADGQTLFFASDMPGSIGGMDIWFCRRDGDSWSKPINPGPVVNTLADEVFPYQRNDGTLFFSSSGHPGLGGLDIFATKMVDGIWQEPSNQGAPMNSSTDDFSIIFDADGKTGYFASDRSGGKGKDDIYSFKVLKKTTVIRGRILASKELTDGMPDTRVQLLDTDGNVLKQATTDAKGAFVFSNIDADKSYLVRLLEDDPGISSRSKYYLTDENNKAMRVTVYDQVGGKYTFQNLPVKPGSEPELLADDEYITIAGSLVTDGSQPAAVANARVKLIDENGNVVQTTTTNALGGFAFTRIPPDKSFIVAIDAADELVLAPNTKVILTDKAGKQIATLVADSTGSYNYQLLKNDRSTIKAMQVDEDELRIDLQGSLASGDSLAKPVANARVVVVDENGNILQTVTTDANGNFKFTNLPNDKSYMVRIENVEDNYVVNVGKMYVKDNNGNIVKELAYNGKFEFKILPNDRTTLGKVYVDDPWLDVIIAKARESKDSLMIIENIYYDLNDWKILPDAEPVLNKIIQVMKANPQVIIEINSHTDSRADDNYNLKLSQKRAQSVADYLVAGGIDKKRLKAVGYGETRLLNKCADGTECAEEEHAANRRTEFKINWKK